MLTSKGARKGHGPEKRARGRHATESVSGVGYEQDADMRLTEVALICESPFLTPTTVT